MASKTVSIPQALQLAVDHHRAGRLQQSENICKRILNAEPDNADAIHLLAVIACTNRKYADGIRLLRKSIEIKPDNAETHKNLGIALNDIGNPDEALNSYQKAVSINPDYAEAHNNLGNVLKELGKTNEAISSYQKALSIKPDYAEALNNLGNAFKDLGYPDKSLESCRKALSIKPGYAEAYNNLGNALKDKGRIDESVDNYKKAISIKPDYAIAHNNLGVALREKGQFKKAIASYRKALVIKPDYAEVHNNLANALKDQVNFDEAIISYRKALSLRPEYAEVHNNLGNVYKDQGDLEKAVAIYRKALAIKPDHFVICSNLLLALNYLPNVSQETIYNESTKRMNQFEEPHLKHDIVSGNERGENQKLRIGYISPDFKDHSVAYFFEPLLKFHNKNKVKVFCYSNVVTPDRTTRRLKNYADHWMNIVGSNDKTVADQIRNDRIDILVDLAGHTANNRLKILAYKPAPIQISWLGYPNTTGMDAVDYHFTDNIADPTDSNADDLHSEMLIRLDNGFFCFQPFEFAPEVSLLPFLKNDHITFGSFNNLSKTTPDVIKCWSEILHGIPEAKILLKSRPLGDKKTKEKYLELFEKQGVSSSRVELYSNLPKIKDHLELYSKVDIGLDPFPYNGTTTTCEALWMGIPVVTIMGDRHAGRVGASIMNQIGLRELLVAENEKKYIKIAVSLANNINKLSEIRKNLRKTMLNSPLCDAQSFANKIEKAYLKMWEKYVSN